MNISRIFRGSLWMVLCFALAARACASEPVIRKLPGPEGSPAIICTVYQASRKCNRDSARSSGMTRSAIWLPDHETVALAKNEGSDYVLTEIHLPFELQ